MSEVDRIHSLVEELFGVNAGYVEKVYGEFVTRPDSVSEEWP